MYSLLYVYRIQELKVGKKRLLKEPWCIIQSMTNLDIQHWNVYYKDIVWYQMRRAFLSCSWWKSIIWNSDSIEWVMSEMPITKKNKKKNMKRDRNNFILRNDLCVDWNFSSCISVYRVPIVFEYFINSIVNLLILHFLSSSFHYSLITCNSGRLIQVVVQVHIAIHSVLIRSDGS